MPGPAITEASPQTSGAHEGHPPAEWLVLLEWMSFGSFFYFLGKVIASTAVSLLLVMLTELLFFRKQKFRTNTI